MKTRLVGRERLSLTASYVNDSNPWLDRFVALPFVHKAFAVPAGESAEVWCDALEVAWQDLVHEASDSDDPAAYTFEVGGTCGCYRNLLTAVNGLRSPRRTCSPMPARFVFKLEARSAPR